MGKMSKAAKEKMDKMFSELAEVLMEYDKLDGQINSMKADIKAYMTKNNLTEIIGQEHKATYKPVNQSRIDAKKLKEDHPRIAKKYTVDSSYMRFNFT